MSERKEIKFKRLPKFPPITRDISLICDESLPVSKIERAIRKSGGKFLEKVELFDIYKGEGIPEGKKSLTYALSFRSEEKTFSDEEVSKFLNAIIEALDKIDVKLRA
jgi:phenylalanyl-tRNA synthetase beta chain